MAKVTIIPSTKVSTFSNAFNPVVKRKVAAYARVSTDSDEQFTSFEAQCNYYENYINSKPDWKLVKVYADEGISGTNTKNRTQFKQMIEDALSGKIDLIITKSISRFARNTLDTIDYTRKLKAKDYVINRSRRIKINKSKRHNGKKVANERRQGILCL